MAISYKGVPLADLIEIYEEALAQEKKGFVTTGGGVGGKSFGRQMSSTPSERIAAALKELRRIDPHTYGRVETHTVASFNHESP